jgi:peptidoglycan hydrolase-like protein with peptidoglycan-binding domain
MNPIADLSEFAFTRARMLCQAVGADVTDMASVWYSESGWYAKAHNPNGDATGLCQMMPATLAGLGFVGGWQVFDRTPAEDQILPWMLRYYQAYAGKLSSAGLCYLATFLPAYLSEPWRRAHGIDELNDDTLLAGHSRLAWVVPANPSFAEADGQIYLRDLDLAIRRNAVGSRWAAITEALGVATNNTAATAYPLTTTLGVQKALTHLTSPSLQADGALGPLTRAAIRQFQLSRHLQPDGIVGPLTRAELRKALAELPP